MSAVLSWFSLLVLLAAVAGSLILPGCREQSSQPIDRNLAPETLLTWAPGDTSTTFYRVRLFWRGFDPDGEVVAYDWAVTDSTPPPEGIHWRRTARTDSVFIFSVAESQPVLGHRFYVRSVDNEGKIDQTPAYCFFSAKDNCAPKVTFIKSRARGPNGELREITGTDQRVPRDTIPSGWSVEFKWRGTDCDSARSLDGTPEAVGKISGYFHHLSPKEMAYLGGTVAADSADYPTSDLQSSLYVLYVRARDDAGLSGQDPALRTFVWNMDPVTKFTQVSDSPGDTARVFYASATGEDTRNFPNSTSTFQAYQPGDTLAISSGGVTIAAKVRAYDPDPPHVVAAFQARLITDSGYWEPIGLAGIFRSSVKWFTGDYSLMTRAQDQLLRWDGTPDTILFHVNKPPRWRAAWNRLPDQTPFTQRPVEGEHYTLSSADTLMVRFAAQDPDYLSGVIDSLTFAGKFDKYPKLDGTPGAEPFFSEVQGGTRANLRPGDPPGTSCWIAAVRLQDTGAAFIHGEYRYTVLVQEVPDEAKYGRRQSRLTVSFWLD